MLRAQPATLADAVCQRLQECQWIKRSDFETAHFGGPFVEIKVEWTRKGSEKIQLLYALLKETGYYDEGISAAHGELECLARLAQRTCGA
jgi:hypothetical protein